MSEMCKAEVFVLVDSNGDSAIGADEQCAREKYEEDVGAQVENLFSHIAVEPVDDAHNRDHRHHPDHHAQ